ncbi:unnamed protein product [Arctia plantaginis]|uniref:Uncharacterized protein n=1 Tax=Arctia plantaginis TaxID=874455 RepID=A0A8S0Z1D8_ARCPL|nr:unnamed protein product [Arctia plantaginis]
MESSEEDKLIINGEMFFSVRKYIRQKKPSVEIIAKIEEFVKDGADINACDGNDNNNTILHIAVQKEEKDVVLYLLQKYKHLFSVQDKQKALSLALNKDTVVGKEIAEILSTQDNQLKPIVYENYCKQLIPSDESHKKLQDKSIIKDHTYEKRAGTSGVSGQFYETKLLSLVLYRALHDKDIKEFYLAANIKDIGDFDDLCFRFNDVACFMQSKHRENTDKAKLTVASVRSSTGKLGLGIYFDSFLKIRRRFSPNATDPMFQGAFDDIDSYFILYTPLKECFDRKLKVNKKICGKLHDIIHTNEKNENQNDKTTDIFQFDFEERDLDFLTKYIKHEQMKTLAKTFLEFILSKNKLEAMMASELVKLYHPALAQQVVLISKEAQMPSENIKNVSNNNCIHIAKFRSEFFYSENDYLMKLKDTFYREIVYTHSAKTGLTKDELKQKIKDIVDHTCAETICQLIGSPLKFDESSDKLSLDINKLPKNMFKQNEIQQIMFSLQNVQVTRSMIRDAVYLAGRKKLQMLTFQLPQSFGNIDLTTNKKKGLDRLNFLASKFLKLIEYYSENNKNQDIKVININNDVVGPGKILEFSHLDSSGIGGAVGNLLEFDKQSESFTFNDRGDLAENAKYVLDKIKEGVSEDLSKYKIIIMIDSFPRTYFDIYQCDKNIASDFLKRLWFYTNQAQEDIVEATLKREISIHYNTDKQQNQFSFHVHSDAIFLRFHDKIQKWWKRPTDAQYLSKNTTIYEEAKKDIVDSPLLTVLSVMFIRKIKSLGVEFNKNAIDNLNLNESLTNNNTKVINIVSDAVMLSAAKIMQCNIYQNKYTYINIDYVHVLPPNDYDTMISELAELNDATPVIISETPLNQTLQDTLLKIINTFSERIVNFKRQIIIITGAPLNDDFKQTFQNCYDISVKDDNLNLTDLTSQSQTFIFNTCEIVYQGQKVKLNKFIDDISIEIINGKLLWSLINKEKIEVGKPIESHKYNEIKKYYINRDLKRDGESYEVNTLNDLDDKIVLISSKPCMGKTVLLTRLSLETKKVNPKLWIVMIDMASCVKELEKIKIKETQSIISFLCKIALKKPKEIGKVTITKINDETVVLNSKNLENISFELQLFIYFYNNGNIIFLFDGFDKIYPQSTNEALELFTALEQARKRMWITSDCYVIKILKRKFGLPYELHRLTTMQQKSFLERFWSTNLQLEKLNYDQCNNLTILLEYILKTFNDKLQITEDFGDRRKLPFLSVPLHIIYLSLLHYFKNESHSLSPCYFRDKIKKEFKLDSFTAVDRYLRNCEENESLELNGSPLHIYIAANYFVFQITDKFDLHLEKDMIVNKSNIYINTVILYERFLKANIKRICEMENKIAAGVEQDGRIEFYENHKKLALYAIYKEKDIVKILTPAEINEAKKTINMIESGEMKTDLIDSVVNGVPKFYHLLFAEYFIVETLSDLLKRVKNGNFDDVQLVSVWDFLVNIVLAHSPPSLRNAFEYKLKYNPELAETASNHNCEKIIFDLLLKSDKKRDGGDFNIDNALNIAINEGLVNITNLLMRSVRNNVNKDNADKVMTIIESSAKIVAAVDPSKSELSENITKIIKSPDGETILKVLNLPQSNQAINDRIKTEIVEPVQKLTNQIVQLSGNKQNLVRLVEELPHHLPGFIREIFK